MKLHVFTMIEAVHLVGTASGSDSEDMSVWSQTFVTAGEATLAIRNAIRDRVYEFYEGADVDDDAIEEIIGLIYSSADNFQWSWDPADRSYIWRIVEDDVYVHCDCEDEDNSDTVMEQLGYRKDDNADAGIELGAEPRLVISFNSKVTGNRSELSFSSPGEALTWANEVYNGKTDKFGLRWAPSVISVVSGDAEREVYDCHGEWESLMGELAYADGDDGSFADPDDLEERNCKYREWYDKE